VLISGFGYEEEKPMLTCYVSKELVAEKTLMLDK
jgi:hypothetical protein